MKNALPTILFLAAGALAAALSYEYQQAAHLQQVIAQMEKDASAARAQSESDAGEVRKMREQVKTYKLSVAQLESINKDLNSGGAKSGDPAGGAGDHTAQKADGPGMMKSFAKMFSDPKMKEMMKAQQAAGVNMMYGDLARELKLSPDEAKRVLEVLGNRQFDIASKGMNAFNKGTPDAKSFAESSEATEAARKSYDDQLKHVLGPEKFTKFQEFEKTIGDRFALDQIQRQLTAGGTPLEASQSQGLLEIMKQERQNAAASPFDPGNRNSAAQAELMQSDDAVAKWMQTQQENNQRVLERARAVLSPDQMLALESAQKAQLKMQQAGVQMSREMLKGAGK